MTTEDLKECEHYLQEHYHLGVVKKGYFWSFIGGAIAFLCVAGFVSYAGAMRALDEKGARVALDSLDRMAGEAKVTLDRIKQTEESWTDGKSGFIQIGDTLVCWGHAEATLDRSPHTYLFNFKFARQFADPPSVSDSIRTNSKGQNYNVFRNDLTTSKYSGRLTEVDNRKGEGPTGGKNSVSMSYVAIGKAK